MRAEGGQYSAPAGWPQAPRAEAPKVQQAHTPRETGQGAWCTLGAAKAAPEVAQSVGRGRVTE